jgi:NarL family two-component system response regulator LiaR
MLVDDHALLRSAIRHALEGRDVTVVAEAGSAPEAIEEAVRAQPDIILVDVQLNGADGVQLVRELAPRLPNATIIMLSVSTSEADLYDAIMAGARGYLTKDMSPEALRRAVQSARRGELVMPRAMAARLVQRLADNARSWGDIGQPELMRLSAREREVLRLLANAQSDRAIAATLTISPRTVQTHVASILRKLEVRNRAEAAMVYRRAYPAGAAPSRDVPSASDRLA